MQTDLAQLLLRLGDMKHLGSIALLDIANTAQTETLGKGQSLPAELQLKRHLYLIEGTIELKANGKVVQTLVAGSERALLPLFRVHTHGLVGHCLTPVKLLALDEATVNRYVATIRQKEDIGISVEEYSEADEEPSIVLAIRHIFHHPEVDLPSLPEVALRINKAISDPDQNLQQLAMEIQADPLIAARVVQVANSALYQMPKPVTSILGAVSRIGVNALQTIVMSVVLQNLFRPKSHRVHNRTRVWYLHSIRVGAIAQILARHVNGFDPDLAFLSGLLHEIGVMPILIQADQRSDLAQDQGILEKVIDELAGQVGKLLLKQWGFSGDLLTVTEQAHDWQRKVEKGDYCDLIQVAQLHCHLVGGNKLDAPPLNQLPAFQRLQLQVVDPVAIVQEAREEIMEIVRLLLR